MALLLLPLMAGIAVAEMAEFPSEITPYIMTAAGIILLAAVVVGWPKRRRALPRSVFKGLAVVLMLLVGFATDVMQREGNRTVWPEGMRQWRGVVIENQRSTAKTWRVSLIVEKDGSARKVMLSILKTALVRPLQTGECVEFDAEIKKPYNYFASNGQDSTYIFDYAKWLERQGYAGQGFAPRRVSIDSSAEGTRLMGMLPWWQRVRIYAQTLRSRLLQQYDKLGLAKTDAAVLAALTLGEKSGISKETRQAFSVSGASHVLALSGLHLSILVTFLLFLLYPLRARRWGMWVIALVCISLTWAFVLLTGCSVSIVRSALMLTLMLLLGMRGEGFASLNNVVVAAFVILCVSPQSLIDVGFQMSFLAVFFIIYFLPYYHEGIGWRIPRWSNRIADFLYVTLIAQLATAPLAACVFGRFPLMFIATNVLVIPCAYILLIGAVLFFSLSWWSVGASAVGWLLGQVVGLLTGGVEKIADLPLSSVAVQLSPLTTLCTYPLIFTFFAWMRFRRHIYAYWSLLFLGLAVSFQLRGL